MSKPKEFDYLAPYIDGTITAATRFRRVLIVMITASVLAFGAFWNSWEGSWPNSRVEVAHDANEYFKLMDQLEGIETQLRELKKKEEQGQPLLAESTVRTGLEEDKKRTVGKIVELDNAKKWLDLKRIRNKDELKSFAEKLETARLDNILLIRIPFFGVNFDINDLGMLGGFTFVVILMWFRFSLWREYFNLHSTFKEADDEHLEFCYKTLAMGQVLTVPPTLYKRQPPQQPVGRVVRLLYFLPVAVQLAIFTYDLYSYKTGWVISKFNTSVSIITSFVCLLLSGFLTYWCFDLSRKIDNKWRATAKRIQKLRYQPPPVSQIDT